MSFWKNFADASIAGITLVVISAAAGSYIGVFGLQG